MQYQCDVSLHNISLHDSAILPCFITASMAVILSYYNKYLQYASTGKILVTCSILEQDQSNLETLYWLTYEYSIQSG